MATLASGLSEEALILRLRSDEHDFVERKSRSDRGGWLETAVAFANSAPIGWPAILFVGVDDDGKPQQSGKLEDLMKSVSGILERAYPPVYRHMVPLHLPDGDCLAVIVPGSETRPHFCGKSFVRDGTQTIPASEKQYELLIAQRNSKARIILQWKGKTITYQKTLGRGGGIAIVQDCNQFFVTLRFGTGSYSSAFTYYSIPLEWIEISHDHDAERNQLKLISRD